VYHLNEGRKVLAFHRWDQGGPGDDVVVVVNFLHEQQDGYRIGFPAPGTWRLRLNSDWQGYSDDFSNHPSTDVFAEAGNWDGLPWQAKVAIGPYSVLIYSQEPKKE
jgi:1,4-alpha-glucan branching enzyme